MNKHGKNFQEYLNNFNNSLVFLPMIEKEINTQEMKISSKILRLMDV